MVRFALINGKNIIGDSFVHRYFEKQKHPCTCFHDRDAVSLLATSMLWHLLRK
ncbi:hypothetical protein PAECIP111890_02646 [Paenibacillus sp. JJ-223]|nr:hypothetical protein PAECIP111890_02646 [Paenibacillus sp. JJ-223]